MKRHWMAFAASFVTAAIITLAGVLFFFEPLAEADPAPDLAPLPPVVAFVIYVAMCVGLFDWLARQMKSASKAAVGLAGSQFALVVDLALRGERGLITLAASGILLAVTWGSVAFVYSRFTRT